MEPKNTINYAQRLFIFNKYSVTRKNRGTRLNVLKEKCELKKKKKQNQLSTSHSQLSPDFLFKHMPSFSFQLNIQEFYTLNIDKFT